MRDDVGKGLFAVLFLGGLLGLLYVMNHPVVYDDETIALGTDWVAIVAGVLCFAPCWVLLPWLVHLRGGKAALDEEMRRDLERARTAPPVDAVTVPFFHGLVRWLTEVGVRGSLQATSLRRRYGHLALAPWPALAVVSTLVVRSANGAFAGPYEDVQCSVLQVFKNEGRLDRNFTCRSAGGQELEETGTYRALPIAFRARVRRGAFGRWLLDPGTIAPN